MDYSTTNSRDSASTSNTAAHIATRSFHWKHDARGAVADTDYRAA
jgi:hypothetical protein